MNLNDRVKPFTRYEKNCLTCGDKIIFYSSINAGPGECINCSRERHYNNAFTSIYANAMKIYKKHVYGKTYDRKSILNSIDDLSGMLANNIRPCLKDTSDNVIPFNYKNVILAPILYPSDKNDLVWDHINGNKQDVKISALSLLYYWSFNNIHPNDIMIWDDDPEFNYLKNEFKRFLQKYGKITPITKSMNSGLIKRLQEKIEPGFCSKYVNAVGPILKRFGDPLNDDDYYSIDESIKLVEDNFLGSQFYELVIGIEKNMIKNGKKTTKAGFYKEYQTKHI